MDDERPAGAGEAEDQLRSEEARRAAAVGFALLRAKHDLNNLFHVARGWSRLLKDPRSGISQTQEGIEAVLSAAEQTSELLNGILALNGRTPGVVGLCNLTQELAILARGLRYLLPIPDRLRVALGAPALVTCNFSDVQRALVDGVLAARASLGNDDLWLGLREISTNGEAAASEVELTLARAPKNAGSEALTAPTLALRFPAGRAGQPRPPQPAEAEASASLAGHFSTSASSAAAVLLVDDHRDVRRLATTMLERAGYQVLTASDAEEALVTSRNYDGPIHVLCCDAQMPGLPALRLITDLCAARPTLKVLVCTGERPEGKLAEFPRLSKPFSYQQLVSAVRGCLE